eukprot:g16341.t1
MTASTISAGDLKTAFLATPRGEWGRFCSHLGPDARKQFAGYVRDVVDTDPTKILKGGRAAAPAFPPASSARMSRGGPAFLFSVDLDAVLQKKREKLAAALGKKSVRGKLATIPEEDAEPGAATTSSKAATSTQQHKFLVAAPRPAENLVQELRDFIRVSLYLKGDDRLQFAIAQSGEIRKQVVIN